VPIWTAEAPSESALATSFAVEIPPAAITGNLEISIICYKSSNVAT
tara:strand:+ start:871 stop:1008 length:138 start_codon:yes stop_codon:yes gene_type:complete